MTELTNDEFLKRAKAIVDAQKPLDDHAKELGYKNRNGVYHRLYRMGFKLGKCIVPINADQ